MEYYSDYSAVCTTEELQSIPVTVTFFFSLKRPDRSCAQSNFLSDWARGSYPGVKATEASSSLLAFVQ